MTDRVFVLGAGRAGQGLARALRASGVDIVGLHGTRADAAAGITAGALPRSVSSATIVLVTVRDAQLDDALRQAAAAPLQRDAVILHASGATDPAALLELRAVSRAAGTFHPLVPLADPARAAQVLIGAWIGVDGDASAVAASQRLARSLAAHTLQIPAGGKARYHAAAVFAANFPTVLAAAAHRLLTDAGIADGDSWDAVLHLMVASVATIHAHRPVGALTGPIVRGDVETVNKHLEALRGDDEASAIYRALSRAAVGIARQGGTDSQLLGAIEKAVTGKAPAS